MKNLIVNTVAALGLFAGALVGMLAATGRLNHEGTKGIPLISSFFPAPEVDPAQAEGEPQGGDAGEEAPKAAATREPEHRGPLLQKGRSVFEPEPAAAQGEEGGHGEDGAAAEDAHGAEGAAPAGHAVDSAQGQEPDRGQAANATGPRPDRPLPGGPGGFFRFEGMPAGLSADKINEYWRRVREATEELERRKSALDLREQELRDLELDITERQNELARQRTRIEEMQRELEARIEEFHSQVKLVRSDEVAALRRNAQTLASFEPQKAAELVQDQWKTEAGQELVLKTLEVMDKDAADAIIAELPSGLIRDVLDKRLRVSRERTGAGK